GIATGRAMLAAMILGADGVQIGSRFAASVESSSHENFKKLLTQIPEGATQVTLKELAPVRLIKNKFYDDLQQAYARCASVDELKQILGRARAKKGMFEGDLEEGELEIGQVSGLIDKIMPVADIIRDITTEFELAKKEAVTL
ncbi:MAG TPA: nitronate monooxygenase, partial [Flavobacterium sp.]|nr:nitronate monooxygenase [Flavobacterium sp.]